MKWPACLKLRTRQGEFSNSIDIHELYGENHSRARHSRSLRGQKETCLNCYTNIPTFRRIILFYGETGSRFSAIAMYLSSMMNIACGLHTVSPILAIRVGMRHPPGMSVSAG